MAGQRYRTNKIKRMHSIIHGLLPILESMARHPAIAQITPGRISASRHAGDHNITLQYYTEAGMKLLARNPSTIQEVFIVTSEPEEVHTWLLREGLIDESRTNSTENAAGSTKDTPSTQTTMSVNGADSRTSPTHKGTSTANYGSTPKGASTASSTIRNSSGNKASGGKSTPYQASVTNNNKSNRNPQSGKSSGGDLGMYAKYLIDTEAPVSDAPTDEILVTDHLHNDTAARLRQLRDKVATDEAESASDRSGNGQAGRATNPTSQGKSNSNGNKGVKNIVKGSSGSQTQFQAPNSTISDKHRSTSPASDEKKTATAPNAPRTNSGKELNPLEAWLAQADDNTFRRLSSKYKGGDR